MSSCRPSRVIAGTYSGPVKISLTLAPARALQPCHNLDNRMAGEGMS